MNSSIPPSSWSDTEWVMHPISSSRWGAPDFPAEVAVVNGFVAVYEKPHSRAVVDEGACVHMPAGKESSLTANPLYSFFSPRYVAFSLPHLSNCK